MIDEALSKEIEESGIDAVKVRSVLTCESKIGACGDVMVGTLRGEPVK